jgi:hypothetical protein
MTITEFINDAYLKATGKTPAPTTGAKYTRLVALGNYYQRRWAREPNVDWNSLYDPAYSLGTVTATDTFDLDTTTVRKLSDRLGDSIRIVHTDNVGYTDYDIIDHTSLKEHSYGVTRTSTGGYYATRIGNNLIFNTSFTSSSPQFGGEILIPAYLFPEPITSENPDDDEVQVDDPDWLVTRVAAEYVRNDITRRQRYPELLAEANEIMQRMIDDNEGSQISYIDRPWTPAKIH